LIGASHIQVGVDLDVFAEYFNGSKPIQLGIPQSTFVPVLEDLAEDKSFNGIVICNGIEYLLLLESKNIPKLSDEYVAFYNNMRFVDVIDQYIAMRLQKTLVLFLSALNPLDIARKLGDREWPVQHIVMADDRSIKADYSMIDIQQYRKNRIKSQLGLYPSAKDTNEIFILNIRRIENAVKKIQERGGRVIIVRFPTSGPLLKMEQRHMPREKYWDYWAAHTSAIMIHFEDYPALAGFQCADYVHIDHRDSPAFTRALATIIKEKMGSQGQLKK